MIIRQRTDHDCAICTIAMALFDMGLVGLVSGDVAYDVIMGLALEPEGDHQWRPFDPEIGCKSEYRILERFGLKQKEQFVEMHRPECIDASYFLRHSWRRRAILAVPSLNKLDGWHSVYFNGKELFDPNNGRDGKKWYAADAWPSLRPNEIILFA